MPTSHPANKASEPIAHVASADGPAELARHAGGQPDLFGNQPAPLFVMTNDIHGFNSLLGAQGGEFWDVRPHLSFDQARHAYNFLATVPCANGRPV